MCENVCVMGLMMLICKYLFIEGTCIVRRGANGGTEWVEAIPVQTRGFVVQTRSF